MNKRRRIGYFTDWLCMALVCAACVWLVLTIWNWNA